MSVISMPWDPVWKPIKSYAQIYVFLGNSKTHIFKGVALPLTATTSLAVLGYFMDKKFTSVAEKTKVYFNQIGDGVTNNDLAWGNFNAHLPKFFGYMLLQQACRIISEYITSLGFRYMFSKIESHLQKEVWNDKALVAISCDKKARNSMVFITNDIYWLSSNCATILSGGLNHAVQAGIGAYAMYNAIKGGKIRSKQLIAPIALSLIQQIFISVLTHYTVNCEAEGRKLAINYRAEQTDAVENAMDVYTSGATDAIYSATQTKKKRLEQINKKLDILHILQITFANISQSMMNVISYISYGRAIYDGQMTHDDRISIDTAASKVVAFLTYGNMSASQIESGRLSLENVLHVLKVAKSAQSALVTNRKFEGHKLILDNYKIKFFEGKETEYTLTFNGVNLQEGDVCLVKGPSGCGKSTLVSQIFGLAQQDHFSTEGDVILPKGCDKKNDLAYVSQNNFAPTDWTLRDVLLMGISRDNKPSDDRMKELLESFDLKGFDKRLDEVIDFKQSTVSGGQKKRLKLINAILKNPKVLIMDEPFAGLDDDAFKLAKNIIKAQLPKCIILNIFHDKDSRSGDGFHTCEMEFRKGWAGKVRSQIIDIKRDYSRMRRISSMPQLAI